MIIKLKTIATWTLACWSLGALGDAAKESEYYRMITLPIPEGIVLEAGGLEFMPDGQLAVSTRFGDIFLIDKPLADPPTDIQFKPFATGLHEVLGLSYRDGWLYATQRGEVTRIKDLDGDGRGDLFETVSDDWGINGDYHEYAFGSEFDRDGNMWVTLCLTGSFTSENPYRGWALRITPEGEVIPTSSGIRSPGGIGMNAEGDMFYTDNQGPWNGTCGLKFLEPGGFMGNPTGNRWYSLTDALGERPKDPESGSRIHIEAAKIPELVPTAIMLPYGKMGNSTSGIACDLTQGSFGPFDKQLFLGDQTHSTVMRVFLEKTSNGRYQGALFPFREGFDSGNLSLEFAPDGSLIVGGTDRGWGARGGKPFALQRLAWTGKVPFEVHEMRVQPDGFELTFTQPVEKETAANLESYQIEAYTYIYQSSYGSPVVDRTFPTIQSVEVAPDGLSARLKVDGMKIGSVHELYMPGVRSKLGEPLLHDVGYYTLNEIPKK
jgi:glucose/arabinose dehydrogenase